MRTVVLMRWPSRDEFGGIQPPVANCIWPDLSSGRSSSPPSGAFSLFGLRLLDSCETASLSDWGQPLGEAWRQNEKGKVLS